MTFFFDGVSGNSVLIGGNLVVRSYSTGLGMVPLALAIYDIDLVLSGFSPYELYCRAREIEVGVTNLAIL